MQTLPAAQVAGLIPTVAWNYALSDMDGALAWAKSLPGGEAQESAMQGVLDVLRAGLS